MLNKILKIIEDVKFIFTKRKILKIARRAGCDIDGDVLNYNGKQYCVCEFNNIVKEVK